MKNTKLKNIIQKYKYNTFRLYLSNIDDCNKKTNDLTVFENVKLSNKNLLKLDDILLKNKFIKKIGLIERSLDIYRDLFKYEENTKSEIFTIKSNFIDVIPTEIQIDYKLKYYFILSTIKIKNVDQSKFPILEKYNYSDKIEEYVYMYKNIKLVFSSNYIYLEFDNNTLSDSDQINKHIIDVINVTQLISSIF